MPQTDSSAHQSRRIAEREALLTAKVSIPRLRPDFLHRARLIADLDGATRRELALVSAPAGYGKTSLLASWARIQPHPVAWVSADPGDNDPIRFWRYVVAAIGRAGGPAADSGLAMPGPNLPPATAVVEDLSRRLSEMADGLALILDDYHVIESKRIHEALSLLLAHTPDGLHVVIGSRMDPPFPLARLRARGQLAELRAPDLRFTPDEAADFLGEVFGLDLPVEARNELDAHTEGWAAGLQLAALWLRGNADPGARVEEFKGSHRFVLDYLTEEVLDRQPEEVRSFLVETSVLQNLSGELCDAVTGRPDGQQMLEGLERANLFLVPLDEERRWYRYHQLFGDLLRVRLQSEPARIPDLHRRAAGWCEQHGLIDEAIAHALQAGEPQWAARLVERHVEELFLTGERATLERWIAALPEDVVCSRARLSLIQALSAITASRLEEAERFLGVAEATPPDPDDPHDPSVGRNVSWLANVPAVAAISRAELARVRGDASSVRVFAASAQAQLIPEDHALSAHPGREFAMADWLEGRVAEAERGLAAFMSESQAAGDFHSALGASFDMAQVQRARGRLRAAMRTHRRALDIADITGKQRIPLAGMALVGMAEVTFQWGRVDEALEHAMEGVNLCRGLVFWQAWSAGLAVLAWIRNAMGDPSGALDAVSDTERAVPQGVVSLLNPAIIVRPRLLLGQGDTAAVRAWVQERGLAEEDEPSYPRELEYLVLARLLLAEHAPDRAVHLLDRIGSAARAQGRMGSLIEARALHALALQLAGHEDQALNVLAEALSLGRHEGYVRVFADEGPPMAALLRRLVATQREGRAGQTVPIDYLGRILRSFDGAARPRAPLGGEAVVAGLAEALTQRELEVLQLLAAGKRNREIASELVVTEDTVKKHISHIFEKLGATTRGQAVAHASELGLIG
jgi:LuxR family transcriptional regulator, maltose regulon positive regulatory protein